MKEESGPSDLFLDEWGGGSVICPQHSPGTCRWQNMVVQTLEPDSQGLHSGALPLDSCLNFLVNLLVC